FVAPARRSPRAGPPDARRARSRPHQIVVGIEGRLGDRARGANEQASCDDDREHERYNAEPVIDAWACRPLSDAVDGKPGPPDHDGVLGLEILNMAFDRGDPCDPTHSPAGVALLLQTATKSALFSCLGEIACRITKSARTRSAPCG